MDMNIRMLWKKKQKTKKNKKFWSIEASPCDEVENMQAGARYGDIAMCFHPRLQPPILNQGTIFEN